MKLSVNKRTSKRVPKKRKTHMRLSRVEVARREKVAQEYFTANPNATGDSFNQGLTTGALTGKPERAMNIKRVFELRKAVRAVSATSEVPPTIPAEEFKNARRFRTEGTMSLGPSSLTPQAQGFLRGLVAEMSRMPLDVQDITVRRDGTVSLGRLARTEQVIALKSSATVVSAARA